MIIRRQIDRHHLTLWGWVMYICINKLTIISLDNGWSPGWHQTIIWTNAGPWGTNFSKISIGIYTFSFKKMHLKMSSGKWQPFCLSLNKLTWCKQYDLLPFNTMNISLSYVSPVPWGLRKLMEIIGWRWVNRLLARKPGISIFFNSLMSHNTVCRNRRYVKWDIHCDKI